MSDYIDALEAVKYAEEQLALAKTQEEKDAWTYELELSKEDLRSCPLN